MWLWACELHTSGFRQRSTRYWQRERRFGLPTNAHLSAFVDASDRERREAGRLRYEVSALHVTFHVGVDHIHFYYHEFDERIWESGGHTSAAEIRRHGLEPSDLRVIADAVMTDLLTALNCELLPRNPAD